jgi:hypothetical protein
VTRDLSTLVGCKRIVTQALITAVEDIFVKGEDLFLDELSTWLAVEHNITIHPYLAISS